MKMNFLYDSDGKKLFNTANVMAFGAVGDGVEDDTSAIQAALDFCKDCGGTIIFPTGVYKLTASVYFYSNQRLVFEGGAKLLQGAEIDNLMMNYSTSDKGGYDATENVEIIGAIFDGGYYTTPNTLFGICHSQNVAIRDCSFVNAYGTWHEIEINSSKNVLVDRCYFYGNRKTGENGEMIQIDALHNLATWPWGNGKIDNTISYMVEVRNCYFGHNTISPAIGNHSEAVSDCIRIHDCIFEGLISSRGAINFNNAKNVDVYNNTFTGCTMGVTIGTADGTNTVHDNRFVGVVTVNGNGINAYDNMVNETIPTGKIETDDTLTMSGAAADAEVTGKKISELSETIARKVNKTGITLGQNTDGLIYIYVDGIPVGTGIELGSQGDVVGILNPGNNQITFTGNLPLGTYTLKYEYDDGRVIDLGAMEIKEIQTYTAKHVLTNVTSSNMPLAVTEGDSFSTTITAEVGCRITSITVTMGGTDITSSAVSGGNISIANVTGDIVITAVAEIINWITESQNADGSLFVGTNGEAGYKQNTRLGTSDGGERTQSGIECTGYIPVAYTDTLYFNGVTITDGSSETMVIYDSSHAKIAGASTVAYLGTMSGEVTSVKLSDIKVEPFSNAANKLKVAYIRISASVIDANSIITKNHPIE